MLSKPEHKKEKNIGLYLDLKQKRQNARKKWVWEIEKFGSLALLKQNKNKKQQKDINSRMERK